VLEAKATWKGKLQFDAWDGEGRHLTLDASKEGGGDGNGFRPAELPLLGLAGCTGMDVLEILVKMRQQVSGFDVRVTSKKKQGYPAGYDGIHIEYTLRGQGIARDKVEQAVKLSAEKYCTVSQALRQATEITHEITIVEE